jgi:hypothetical protein
MRKYTIIFLVILSIFIPIRVVEGSNNYLWSNQEAAFWIDDEYLATNTKKTLAIADIIFENMITGEMRCMTNQVLFYKDDGKWMVSVGDTSKDPKEVMKYAEYWQYYAIEWLVQNGYLKE